MAALIILTVLIIGFLIMWTKFNADETKSINNRWEKLLKAEDVKENNFAKIKYAIVSKLDESVDEIKGVNSFVWDRQDETLKLCNMENRIISIYKLSDISNVYFVREGDE